MATIEEREQCRDEFYKVSRAFRGEFLSWGCPAGNSSNALHTPLGSAFTNDARLDEWIDLVKKYPGFLLDVAHAAARLGITLESFKKIQDVRVIQCLCPWTLPKGQYYYAFLIEQLYSSLLDENMVYASLITSNLKVAKELRADLANCIVCKEAAVNTLCDYCGSPVEPAHIEPLHSLRPLLFPPEQVCWRCLFVSPQQSYPLILSEDRVKEALCEAIDKRWLMLNEINGDWQGTIRDYKYQPS
jgi:hypothetical protein